MVGDLLQCAGRRRRRGPPLRAAILLALLPWIPDAAALDPTLALTQYSHRAWTSDQGESSLPQNSVFSIVQTRDGYLWLATQEGLVRFDGVRFEVFNQRNTAQIRHNDIWRLLETPDGSLWIGTRGGGLVRYRDGAFSAITKEQGLADDSVHALWQDRAGVLWIGTRGGLVRYVDGAFTTYTRQEGLGSDTVYAVLEDRRGTLWIGTDGGGLNRYADGVFKAITKADGLPSDTVYAIHEDRAGSLWIGTGAGLVLLRDGTMTVYRTAEGLSNDNIRAIAEDGDGNLWIGTDGGGLNRLRDGRFSALTRKDGLSNDSIGAIYEDRERNLWIGTDAGGLNQLRDNRFVTYGTPEGLSNDNARAVLEDREGALWIGTFGGLNRLKDGGFTAYGTKDGLSSEVVLSMLEDREGALWLGTLGGGINRFKDGRFTVHGPAQGLSNDTVLCLLQDRDGVLWAGTRSGGLNRLENGRWRAYGTQDGLSSNDVRVLHQGRDGALWIGTRGGGLNRYQDGRFTSLTKADGLSSDLVFAIHEDADGSLWIGTFGGGLNRYKDGRFTAYTVRNGLYDDSVFQILEDAQGWLWMSSNRGVFRVDKRELDALAAGDIAAITSIAYGKADGMRSNEGNGAHQPAGWKTRDGRLWFATIKGVVTVDPARLHANALAPPVLIERVYADAAPVAMRGRTELAPGTRKLEFHYTGLSFPAPEKVHFRYQLEGFDSDWVDAGTKRIAYYTNLAPGDYRFRVSAANNDGLWNETGAAVEFHLQPFFYQTRLFYLAYLAAAVALVALALWFHRVRVRQLQGRERELLTLMHERQQAQEAALAANLSLEQRNTELARSNAELERFAYAASHDLQEPLRTIISFTQLLARKLEPQGDAEASDYMRYVVDAARSMRARVENLLKYARLGAAANDQPAQCESAEALDQALAFLRAAIADSGAVITRDVLPGVAVRVDELVHVFQNLIDNAIKFHGRDVPRIHVSAEPVGDGHWWRFCVSDNGLGIDPRHAERIFGLFQRLHSEGDYPGTGVGLAMCRKLVETRGGKIWVESAPGAGSRFLFTVPAVAAQPDAQAAPATPESGRRSVG